MPDTLLRLGQLRAKSLGRSFSGHVAALLRVDCAAEISHMVGQLEGLLRDTKDGTERERLTHELEALRGREMTSEDIAETVLAEAQLLHEGGAVAVTGPPAKNTRYKIRRKSK